MERFTKERGLQVNVAKTKIMIFGSRTPILRTPYKFFISNEALEVVSNFKDLGLTINRNVAWPSSCITKLIEPAKRALYALKAKCLEIGIAHPSQIVQLFDALVKPILLYACEIWGPDLSLQELFLNNCYARKIEKIHLDILRWVLGVRRSTPAHHLRGEFGRMPLSFSIIKSTLKYCERLAGLDDQRLLKIAFNHSCKLDSQGHKTWVTSVRSLIISLGIGRLDENLTLQGHWASKLQDIFIEKWSQDLSNSVKGPLYLQIKNGSFMMADYLFKLQDFKKRRTFARMVTGSHSLAIEMGRQPNVERHNRKCEICHCVENEHHFCFDCPLNDGLRQKYNVLFKADTRSVPLFLQQDCTLIANFLYDGLTLNGLLHQNV